MFEIKDSNWIWYDEKSESDIPVLVLFRKKLVLDSSPVHVDFQISADSRYKLYVNGNFVEVGPSRGDSQVWFYDTIDLISYLKSGENVLAVEVLRYANIVMILFNDNITIFTAAIGGYVGTAQVQSVSAITGMKVCMIGVPVVLQAVLIILLWFYDLDEKLKTITLENKEGTVNV